KFLSNYVSAYDATVIKKIKNAGAVIIGKTNMDEFAMGSSNEFSAYGPVKNPVDPERVPGGSSGGPASAVAAGIVDYALGSDTGGSIRQPAAFTGTVGLKPTYGRVSRYGLTAFASSLDQIGPMTKNVRQNAELLEVIAGHDSRDSSSADVPVEKYSKILEKVDPKNIKISVPFKLLEKGIEENVLQAFHKSIDLLKGLGFIINNVELPHLSYAIAAYYILAPAEASSNLARFDGVRYGVRSDEDAVDLNEFFSNNRAEGFGDEVKRRIMLGTYVLSSGYYDAYYLKAQKVRRLLFNDYRAAFEKSDVILTPTTPGSAFRLGEFKSDPLQMYLNDIFTVSANITGIPALSLPLPVSNGELPVGIQLSGNVFREGTLLQLAHFMEQEEKDIS
ncbi:MAG: Asp-tRNA(Asn)/Glu-tRNA(Gln) amidotransferase subunit GatA, partial [Candidatus Marinimicrobia bacterium]|nr:Asp-tRNA(Asn)/Glu-tRNA(Gln) amidotransferase subunit GatA [Candidatus Neomarinimicrobiota bacterium]